MRPDYITHIICFYVQGILISRRAIETPNLDRGQTDEERVKDRETMKRIRKELIIQNLIEVQSQCTSELVNWEEGR